MGIRSIEQGAKHTCREKVFDMVMGVMKMVVVGRSQYAWKVRGGSGGALGPRERSMATRTGTG